MWEKNKVTTKCDKSTIKCNVDIAECDNRTIECEKKKNGTNKMWQKIITCDVGTI